MTDWQGVFPAVTTRFKADLSLDHDAMRTHFAWQIEAGVDGLITTGSLGEAGTLSIAEKLQVAEIAVEASGGRVPVLATVAESATTDGIGFVRAAEERGVDGFMALPGIPYVSDRRETVQHFQALADAATRPIMIYNNPVAYGVDLDLEGVAALAQNERFVAIKESSNDIRRVTDIFNRFGDRFRVFAGVDDLALESLFMGADGWVAGLVDAFPHETVAIYRLAAAGRREEALEIYRWFSQLLKLDVSTKLVQNIKLAGAVIGTSTEYVRAPRLTLQGDERTEVERIVREALKTRPTLPRIQ